MRGKGEGSIFKDSRGLWTASVELPPIDGKRRRKTIRSKSKRVVIDKLAQLKLELRDRGDLPSADQTVEQWLRFWVTQIAPKKVVPNTLDGYRRIIDNHVIPVIGTVRLSKVQPAHLRRVYGRMTEDLELSSTYALLAHRTLSVAFKAAEREGRLSRNPCDRIDPPRKSTAKQEALDLDEAVAVLEFVASLGNVILGARWATSILTGARRGEVLGIERDRITRTVNPKTGAEEWSLDLSWQLQRLPLTERDGRPDVPADFEYRHLVGGLYLTRPKSSAGWRVIPLVDPLRSILLRILDLPEENPYGLLFSINGRPMDPDQDSKRWREVLAAAGIERDVVLHGLRHTAIDLLYLAGVPEDITMQIVGQATLSVTRGYQSRGAVNRARMFAALEQFSALFNSRDAGTRPAIDV